MVKNVLKLLTALLIIFPLFNSGIYAQTVLLPVFQTQPNFYGKVGVYYSYTPFAFSPSGSNISYNLNQAPSWLRFNTNTHNLNGTPANAGTFNIAISATDSGNQSSYQYFNLIVSPAPTAIPTQPVVTVVPTINPTKVTTPTPVVTPVQTKISTPIPTATVIPTSPPSIPIPTITVPAEGIFPNINNETPKGDISDKTPAITAEYTSASGVVLSSVRITLDGVDKTPKALITSSTISYKPSKSLSLGKHTITLSLSAVGDKGKTTTNSWSFNIKNNSSIFDGIGGFLHDLFKNISGYILFIILIIILAILVSAIATAALKRRISNKVTENTEETTTEKTQEPSEVETTVENK